MSSIFRILQRMFGSKTTPPTSTQNAVAAPLPPFTPNYSGLNQDALCLFQEQLATTAAVKLSDFKPNKGQSSTEHSKSASTWEFKLQTYKKGSLFLVPYCPSFYTSDGYVQVVSCNILHKPAGGDYSQWSSKLLSYPQGHGVQLSKTNVPSFIFPSEDKDHVNVIFFACILGLQHALEHHPECLGEIFVPQQTVGLFNSCFKNLHVTPFSAPTQSQFPGFPAPIHNFQNLRASVEDFVKDFKRQLSPATFRSPTQQPIFLWPEYNSPLYNYIVWNLDSLKSLGAISLNPEDKSNSLPKIPYSYSWLKPRGLPFVFARLGELIALRASLLLKPEAYTATLPSSVLPSTFTLSDIPQDSVAQSLKPEPSAPNAALIDLSLALYHSKSSVFYHALSEANKQLPSLLAPKLTTLSSFASCVEPLRKLLLGGPREVHDQYVAFIQESTQAYLLSDSSDIPSSFEALTILESLQELSHTCLIKMRALNFSGEFFYRVKRIPDTYIPSLLKRVIESTKDLVELKSECLKFTEYVDYVSNHISDYGETYANSGSLRHEIDALYKVPKK
jgi:hypothetical protein